MSRKTMWIVVPALLTLACAAAQAQTPVDAAFTYQGQLKLNSAPVNSTADFIFKLFDAATGGTQVGADVAVPNVTISNGLFTVLLDFGESAFGGEARWVDIQVRSPAGGGSYTQLTPRQELTATPYASFSAAPWQSNSGKIYYNGGFVGIGVWDPQLPFHVNGWARFGGAQYGGGGVDGNFVEFEPLGTDRTNVRFDTASLSFGNPNYPTEIMRLTRDGNVGIGTTTPGFPLTFPDESGDKISLFGQSGDHYGFGIQPSELQIHAASPAHHISLGWGRTDAFTEVMRVEGDGYVGVNGATKLDWSDFFGIRTTGNDFGGMNIQAPALAYAKPYYGYHCDNGVAAWHWMDVVTGDWHLHLGNADRLNVLASGAVGINTTTPQTWLHVNDTLRVGGQVQGGGGVDGDGVWLAAAWGTDHTLLRYDSAKFMLWNPNYGTTMCLTRDGNVGIGTTTPTFPLTVAGSENGWAGSAAIELVNTTPSTGRRFGIGSSKEGLFQVFDESAGNATRLVVDGDGYVGIGTIEPQAMLHVAGGGRFGGNQAGGGGNPGDYMSLSVWNPSRANVRFEPDNLVFENPNCGDIMTLAGNGRVGIGTTTPGQKLSVAGTVESTTGGFKFPDGTVQTTAAAGGVGGSGTVNYVPKFTAPTTLGNSAIVDTGGHVGIGTSTPGFPLSFPDTLGDKISFWGQSGDHHGIGVQTQELQIYGRGIGDHIAFGWGRSAAFHEVMRVEGDGRVGIGTTEPQATLDVVGTTRTHVLEITGGADLAEPFGVTTAEAAADSESAVSIEAGMVVVIDPDRPGELKLATAAYDRKVAGVISGAAGVRPGMVMSGLKDAATGPERDTASTEQPVALTGRVWCWCDASYGSIEPGDRLTTSGMPGHAMKATDRDRADGAVIGKAMTQLEHGKGLVLVLVQPQ